MQIELNFTEFYNDTKIKAKELKRKFTLLKNQNRPNGFLSEPDYEYDYNIHIINAPLTMQDIDAIADLSDVVEVLLRKVREQQTEIAVLKRKYGEL